jgi:gamma-butyrobetaine dioxygenase
MTVASIDSSGLRLVWDDGLELRPHPTWLRDSCACGGCVDPRNGQRLFDPADLPADPTPTTARVDGAMLRIAWAPDGHAGIHDLAALRAFAARADRRPRPHVWGRELAHALPVSDHDAVTTGPAGLYRWLSQVRDFGFSVLRGVPRRDGEVERVAELFWHVHETNYGRHFEVISVPDPENLAYTARTLAVHTDNPYAEPVPGLQLLHCLEQSADGGDTLLVDGFDAAERLRRECPEAFAVLTRVPASYRYRHGTVDLRARRPIITLGHDGGIVAVNLNDRSLRPPEGPDTDIAAYYPAYRAFVALLREPAANLRLKLAPGDLLIFDNQRVLHGREGYEAGTARRHLQGCYVDRGGLASRLRGLAAELGLRHVDAGLPGADRDEAAIDRLFAILADRGVESYLGEPVSQVEHALQTATAAAWADATPALVTAALFHDIGHFLHDFPENCAELGIDSRHEDAGAAILAGTFGPEAVEPVRLHVDAKRYLAAAEPGYFDRLSPASVLSLRLQGGPFDAAAAAAFKARAYAEDAIRLRRWDEAGKTAGVTTPDLEHFRRYVRLAAARPA